MNNVKFKICQTYKNSCSLFERNFFLFREIILIFSANSGKFLSVYLRFKHFPNVFNYPNKLIDYFNVLESIIFSV